MKSGIDNNNEMTPYEEIKQGLSDRTQKYIPSKFFYDERGSELFEKITLLDEYYLTRTEYGILKNNIEEITGLFDKDTLFIEYGSGSSRKTRLLLDNIEKLAAYVPIDISEGHLMESAHSLEENYPEHKIFPIAADFTKIFSLPVISNNKRIVFFPGSSIGNFSKKEAEAFMKSIRDIIGESGGLLIGIDLVKDSRVLEAAYDDSRGITANFNKNILSRLNTEFEFDFNLEEFDHFAYFNNTENRIEMHLISKSEQIVNSNNFSVNLRKGETILTEYSNKYTVDSFVEIASGIFIPQNIWKDKENFFAVMYLSVT